jgi:NAD(P)-dependent dehydrogenase (short-subunit alcohol dehydrogenase family)
MRNEWAIVTGATRGIGEAIAEGLSAEGFAILGAGRDAGRGEAVIAGLTKRGVPARFLELDQGDPASVDRFVAAIATERTSIRILVNNAGASFEGFDADVARRTLDVNFAGMMRLTDGLLPLLANGARIVMVSSGMGELSCLGSTLREAFANPALDRPALLALVDRFVTDVREGTHAKRGWPSNAYRVSKVAMNAYVRILARDLTTDPRMILVNAACPGWVRTAMGGRGAPRSVEEGARTPLWLATLPPDGPTGAFFRDEHPIPF